VFPIFLQSFVFHAFVFSIETKSRHEPDWDKRLWSHFLCGWCRETLIPSDLVSHWRKDETTESVRNLGRGRYFLKLSSRCMTILGEAWLQFSDNTVLKRFCMKNINSIWCDHCLCKRKRGERNTFFPWKRPESSWSKRSLFSMMIPIEWRVLLDITHLMTLFSLRDKQRPSLLHVTRDNERGLYFKWRPGKRKRELPGKEEETARDLQLQYKRRDGVWDQNLSYVILFLLHFTFMFLSSFRVPSIKKPFWLKTVMQRRVNYKANEFPGIIVNLSSLKGNEIHWWNIFLVADVSFFLSLRHSLSLIQSMRYLEISS